jgi:chemotaxis response regulator CheB
LAGYSVLESREHPGVNFQRPYADALFGSLAETCEAKAMGMLLTGTGGSDGAQGLQRMVQSGAFTIARDEATRVVFGRPQGAIHPGAACPGCATRKDRQNGIRRIPVQAENVSPHRPSRLPAPEGLS